MAKEKEVTKETNTKAVKRIQTHVGVMLNFKVMTSIDHKANNVEMETTPMGVKIKGTVDTVVVPYANIHQFTLLDA